MKKYLLYFICTYITLVFSVLPSHAITEGEMVVHLSLSGKQRMLTQKMSKEALLIAKGVNTAGNKANLKKTAALFDKTLKGLINGDADLKLVKVGNPKIVKQLNKVAKLWSGFSKNVDSVLGGDTSKGVLEKIAKENLPLLKNMNRVVKMFENHAKKQGGKSLSPGMAVTINLSGKQRMLTQKMTKEFLLVANGINTDKNIRNLKQTASLFERTLKGLMDGDKDLELPGTKDQNIRDQLNTVEEHWKKYKLVLDKVIVGGAGGITAKGIETAAMHNMHLLKKMNKAVGMYVESVK